MCFGRTCCNIDNILPYKESILSMVVVMFVVCVRVRPYVLSCVLCVRGKLVG